MTTIRLSDRLMLEGDRLTINGPYHALTHRTTVSVDVAVPAESFSDDGDASVEDFRTFADALIALANPPRYDLPPGIIHGSDGRFYAPGPVVRTLPDEMWDRNYRGQWYIVGNGGADALALYEVRPTAANPLKPLPEHTFPLPDGTLACFRRDAAKLREAGATLRYTDTSSIRATPEGDHHSPDQVLRVEFPPTPKTERVPWFDSLGRSLPDGRVITHVADDLEGGPFIRCGAGTQSVFPTVDGESRIEVLLTDTER